MHYNLHTLVPYMDKLVVNEIYDHQIQCCHHRNSLARIVLKRRRLNIKNFPDKEIQSRDKNTLRTSKIS